MKRLLIVIDGSDNDASSLTSAMLVARGLEANISVVHPTGLSPSVYNAAEVAAIRSDVDAAHRTAERAKTAYNEVCARWHGSDWSETLDSEAEIISRLGPYSDLIVIERLSEEQGPSIVSFNIGLFETGTPVLIAPPRAPARIATRPVIAWNGSRQAIASVKSALPLLKLSSAVVVLAGESLPAESFSGLERYLKAHGVEISVAHYPSDQLTARGRARSLLKAVADLSGDLLVMGAYGESTMDSIFGLGRATQKIVTAAQIPVFLQQ
ncbi:MAG: universal stress protein [Pseudomonadota bacterium]